MQAIAPVTTAQLLQKEQRPPLLKFEILVCCCWVDLTPYVIANTLSISTAGAEMTPAPVAGEWSISLFNKNGRFDPDEDAYAPRNEYLRVGRKIRISIGARYGGVDYYWRRIYGFMELPEFSIDNCEVYLNGFDNMQFLTDTKLRMPYNYWGAIATFDSVETTQYGAELYDSAAGDAAEIIPGEANLSGDWAVHTNGATAISSQGQIGGFSLFELEFISDPAVVPGGGIVWYQGVCAVVAGTEYYVTFKYARTAGDAWLRFLLMDGAILVGGSGNLKPAANNVFYTGSFSFTPEANGNLDLRLICAIKPGDTAPTTWRVDNISIRSVTSKVVHKYQMPDACNGIHYVELDEGVGFVPIWPGRQKTGEEGWFYDPALNQLYFAEGKIVVAGTNNLKVHYYTQQIPEEVVADLLVRAGLYDTQAEALAAMIYTATGITIDKVWFQEGGAVIDAVRMLCERCNYRFYFNYGQRPVFNPAPAPVATCDIDDDWVASAGGVLSIDTGDKKMGAGSLKNTVAVPIINTDYLTSYNPAGSWDWFAKEHILFWLKCDRVNTAFTWARFYIYDTLGNWRRWDLTFSAGEWTAVRKLLSTGDLESGVPPNLALINYVRTWFRTADVTPFYEKIDDLRVTDFTFTESHINNIRDYEDRSEIRNRIVIEGIEQALPEGAEETRPSKFKGEASEVASINKYGEHTMSIKNHLFQDQATIEAYCAIYLAAFKDPKWYTTFDMPFNPIPLEKGDTGTWRKKYEVGGTPIDQRGIIRDIQINEFIISYIIEKLA